MSITFVSIEQAREELPGFGWAVTTRPGGAEQALCPGCAARIVPWPQAQDNKKRRERGSRS
jgi:hypothetical protein